MAARIALVPQVYYHRGRAFVGGGIDLDILHLVRVVDEMPVKFICTPTTDKCVRAQTAD